LDLTLEDVGACIEIIYTPVRKDGIKGNPKHIVSDLISPGKIVLLVKWTCYDYSGTSFVNFK